MEIANKNIQVQFSKTGAEIVSLKYLGKELLWQKQKGFWPAQAPILFPFCGFLKDGYFLIGENKYESPVHGFVSAQKFSVEFESDKKIIFSLEQNDETLQQFPFNFKLSVSYEIVNNSLNVNFTVKNTNQNKELPFSIGWHPGFIFGEKSYLELEKSTFQQREVCENGLIGNEGQYHLTEGKLKLDENTFASGGIVLEKADSNIKLVHSDLLLDFNFKEFPNLVLWGQPGAKFVCIEPWYGMGDLNKHNHNFFEKIYLNTLKSNKSKSFSLSLSIESL